MPAAGIAISRLAPLCRLLACPLAVLPVRANAEPIRRSTSGNKRSVTKPLWAPWRLEYIQQADEQEGCVFCRAAAGDDSDALVVARGEQAFVLLNKFPYS